MRHFEELVTRLGFFIWDCRFLKVGLLIHSTELTAEYLKQPAKCFEEDSSLLGIDPSYLIL